MTGGMYSATPLESIISNYIKRDYDIGTYGWHRRDCWNGNDDDNKGNKNINFKFREFELINFDEI